MSVQASCLWPGLELCHQKHLATEAATRFNRSGDWTKQVSDPTKNQNNDVKDIKIPLLEFLERFPLVLHIIIIWNTVYLKQSLLRKDTKLLQQSGAMVKSFTHEIILTCLALLSLFKMVINSKLEPNVTAFDFLLMYVAYLFPPAPAFIGVHFTSSSLPDCQNAFSLMGRDMRKWHGLSCPCPSNHDIFHFVYFTIQKGGAAADTFALSRTVDVLVIIWNGTLRSDAVCCVITLAGRLETVKTHFR